MFKDALEKLGAKVDYLEISDAINSDAAQGTPVITSYIASHPDVKLIITDHGNLTSTLGTSNERHSISISPISRTSLKPTFWRMSLSEGSWSCRRRSGGR
jgi:hypothetical protein